MNTKRPRLFIFVLGMLTAFGPLSIDLYLPAFPAMAADLGVAVAELQYTLTSFFIGLSIGQLIYGPISDKWGRKKPLLFGISLFIVTSILIVFVDNLSHFILLRFIQALGSCVGMVITRAIIRDSFESKDVAKVFSLILLIMGVAPIFAPVIGAQILNFSGWRGMFVILTGFGILALLGAIFFISESLKVSVNFKKSFSNYLLLLKDKHFLIASIIGGTTMAALFSYISSSSIVFMEIFKLSKNTYPMLFGLNAFGFILFSQLNIRLLNRYSLEKVLFVGLSVFFLNTIFLGVAVLLDCNIIVFEFLLFCSVAFVGLIMPNVAAKALEFQSMRAGVASALMGSLQFFIASLGTILVTALAPLGIWAMVLSLEFFAGTSFLLYYFFFYRSK